MSLVDSNAPLLKKDIVVPYLEPSDLSYLNYRRALIIGAIGATLTPLGFVGMMADFIFSVQKGESYGVLFYVSALILILGCSALGAAYRFYKRSLNPFDPNTAPTAVFPARIYS